MKKKHQMRPNSIKKDAMHTQLVFVSMWGVWVKQWWSVMVLEVTWGFERSQNTRENRRCFAFLAEMDLVRTTPSKMM